MLPGEGMKILKMNRKCGSIFMLLKSIYADVAQGQSRRFISAGSQVRILPSALETKWRP